MRLSVRRCQDDTTRHSTILCAISLPRVGMPGCDSARTSPARHRYSLRPHDGTRGALSGPLAHAERDQIIISRCGRTPTLACGAPDDIAPAGRSFFSAKNSAQEAPRHDIAPLTCHEHRYDSARRPSSVSGGQVSTQLAGHFCFASLASLLLHEPRQGDISRHADDIGRRRRQPFLVIIPR